MARLTPECSQVQSVPVVTHGARALGNVRMTLHPTALSRASTGPRYRLAACLPRPQARVGTVGAAIA